MRVRASQLPRKFSCPVSRIRLRRCRAGQKRPDSVHDGRRPEPGATVEFMHALAKGGADVIELGVPFSDPMADGPVIQQSSERALAQWRVAEPRARRRQALPRNRRQDARRADGLRQSDRAHGHRRLRQSGEGSGRGWRAGRRLPAGRVGRIRRVRCELAGIDPIFLLAPTSTDERIAEVGKIASGYVYYVSLKGVTGSANLDVSSIASKIPAIKSHVSLPVGVGFGIRDAQTARAVAEVSDAVVIGSRLVQLLEQASPDDRRRDRLRVSSLKCAQALDSVATAR